MTYSLLGYSAYLPVYRLPTSVARGRVVAAFDEDSTTMAVAAATDLSASGVPALYLATTSPAYLDKTNAVAVHAALGLPADVFAADLAGSGRSGVAALRAAATGGGLVVLSDVRVGKPGSADERGGGDGAAAFLFGPPTGPVDGSGRAGGIAEVLGWHSESAEFLDRWRSPASVTGEAWEERFGFEQYAPLIRSAVGAALDGAGLAGADHVVLASSNSAVVKRASALVKGALSTTTPPIGFAGTADLGLALAAVLDTAGPGETIALVSAVDGCDVVLLRTTSLLPERRQPRSVAEQLAGGRDVPHLTYLAWRGLVERELPRRPEPDRPAGPPSARAAGWKYGFAGSRCSACGFAHLPPARVCRRCAALDAMEPLPAGRLQGRVATYTVDRLAYSPSPPVVDVVVDFDGGGRTTLELADAEPAVLAVGTRVEVAFRCLFTAGGVHNYFWKARVVS